MSKYNDTHNESITKNNKLISNILKTYDDYTLAIAYENIFKFKKEGSLALPCVLSLIHDDICQKMGWNSEHYTRVEAAILLEIATRFHDRVLRER